MLPWQWGQKLQEPKYIQAAEKAVEFILSRLVDENGRLLARYRDGRIAYPAYLDDYAYLVWGLIELYQAAYKPLYLDYALRKSREMIDLSGTPISMAFSCTVRIVSS